MNFVVQLVISFLISAAVTLIQAALQQNRKNAQGVRGEIQVGGDNPLAFIVGRYATAGQLEYVGSWGEENKTPNAYFTKVVSVSDLPVRGLAGFFVDGKRVTLADTPDAALGYPVLDYRVNGKDHLWVKFYDGTQTTADTMLLAKFGSDPDRPWQSDMVFRGVAYFIATALVNRELFPGFPDYIAELDGIELDDPREGSEENDNPAVGIYTILQGLHYDGEWIYGPQGVTAGHLVGFGAQMDKCDAAVALAGGGTEKRFRFGYEVVVDQEPHAVIGEMLKACAGRIAEIGGRYRILVAEPDEPVVSFTDEDIVVTEDQSLDPFPGLEETYNAITATYPEPEEAWSNKDAPPRYSSALELADNSRRLPFAEEYKAVPFGNQVQRLMRLEIEEARRFRRHGHTAPPSWYEYEPLDVAAWTSAHNQYDAKRFLITIIEDRGDSNQVVGLQEIDPSDYHWQSVFELPFDLVPLPVSRPPAQPMFGWRVEPYIFVDADSHARRPGVEVFFSATQEDVRSVHIQGRLKATEAGVFDGEAPYTQLPEGEASHVPQGTWLADTEYEFRGRFLPYSGRETEWSAWLAVTTPDIRIAASELDDDANALLNSLRAGFEGWIGGRLAALEDRIEQVASANGGAYAASEKNLNESIDVMGQRVGTAEAQIVETRRATADNAQAIADYFLGLRSINASGEAESQYQITTAALPEGAAAAVEHVLRAGVSGQLAQSAFRMIAYASEEGAFSRVELAGDYVDLIDGDGNRRPMLSVAIDAEPRSVPIVSGSPNTATIDLRGYQANHEILVDDDFTLVAPIGAKGGQKFCVGFRMDGGGGHSVSFDSTVFLGEPPEVDDTGSALTIIECVVWSTNPLQIATQPFGGGDTEVGSNRSFSISPSVGGKSVWNLDTDGPLETNNATTYTITPLGAYLDATISIWGPGGTSGGITSGGGVSNPSGPGTPTTFEGMTANAGQPSNGTNGGAGGSASGGDTNDTGEAGGNRTGASSFTGGTGGAAPGGTTTTGGTVGGTGTQVSSGQNPDAPGGGASGKAAKWIDPGNSQQRMQASGGGGGGGRCVKTFGPGELTNGNPYEIVIGTAVNPPSGQITNGKKGANGGVRIE